MSMATNENNFALLAFGVIYMASDNDKIHLGSVPISYVPYISLVLSSLVRIVIQMLYGLP